MLWKQQSLTSYKLSLAISVLYHTQKRSRTHPLVKPNLYPPTGSQTPINFMCIWFVYFVTQLMTQYCRVWSVCMLWNYYTGMNPILLSPMFRQRTRYNPSTKIKNRVAQQISFALILVMYPAPLGTLQLLMYLWPASVIHILDASDSRRRFLLHSWFISDTYTKYMNSSRKLHEWHRNKLPKLLPVILCNCPGILL